MPRSDPGFYINDALGACSCLTKTGEGKHSLDVNFQCVENLSVLGFAVVGLIRQGQTTLFHKHDVALGVAGVIVDKEPPQPLNT